MAKSVAEINEVMVEASGAISAAGHYCSYEAFGVRFFEHAVNPDRIYEAMSELVGKSIDFGPKAIGPARLVRITAAGHIGEVVVTRCFDDTVTYRLLIPVNLDLTVRVAGQNHHFHVELRAGLTLTARAAEPLRVIIDVAPPSTSDVQVTVKARGLRAALLRSAANVDEELRRFVARYIRRELDKPYIRRIREIDIAHYIGKAWD